MKQYTVIIVAIHCTYSTNRAIQNLGNEYKSQIVHYKSKPSADEY